MIVPAAGLRGWASLVQKALEGLLPLMVQNTLSSRGVLRSSM